MATLLFFLISGALVVASTTYLTVVFYLYWKQYKIKLAQKLTATNSK